MANAAPPVLPTADFVAAMAHHVSSVCVITTIEGSRRYGLTATAVSSVCATPPRLLVCVNTSGITHAKIAASKILCVNVVGEDQEKVAKAFAGMMGRDFDRFSAGEWGVLSTGSPVLQNATAVFDCKVAEQIAQSTHSVFMCDVVAIQRIGNSDPLLYGARRFRTLRKVVASTAPEELAMESLHF